MKTIDDAFFDEILAPEPDPRMPVDLLPRVLSIPSRSRAGRITLLRGGLVAVAATVLLLAWLSTSSTRPTGGPVIYPDPPTLGERVLAAAQTPGGVPEALFFELGETALVPLHRLALGEDVDVARNALRWIGRIASPRSLPTLAAAAGRPDRQQEAVGSLAGLGPRALPTLAPLLAVEAVFDAALDGVATSGGPRSADVLARAAATCEDEARRRQLLTALARTDGRPAVRQLLAFLADETVGGDVLELLAAERERLVPHLIALAGEEDAALRALVLLAPPEAVPTLARLMDERDRRSLAARALARIDTPEAAEALLARAGDEAVVRAAGFAGPRLEVHLLRHFESAHRHEMPDLITLLGEAGGDISVPTLIALAKRPDLGPAALTALSRIGTPRAIRTLASLGGDDHCRRGAIAALGATGRVEAVTSLIRLGREHRGVRRDACRALARIPAAAAVEGILLLEREGGTGREARRALARMDDDLVRKTLSQLVEGDLRPQAKRALSDLGVPAGPPRAATLL